MRSVASSAVYSSCCCTGSRYASTSTASQKSSTRKIQNRRIKFGFLIQEFKKFTRAMMLEHYKCHGETIPIMIGSEALILVLTLVTRT